MCFHQGDKQNKDAGAAYRGNEHVVSLFALCDDSIKGPGIVYRARVQYSDASHITVTGRRGRKKLSEIKGI